MQCGFAGNPDIYGLGIRLGYYTQALAVWFANYFLYRDAKSLRGANLIFILALLIAICIYAFNAGTTYAIEVFLLLQIGLCMGMVSLSSGTRFSSRYMKEMLEVNVIRTAVIYTGLAFNAWFWWRSLDLMLPTPCKQEADGEITTKHRTYVMYIVKVDIYGPVRTAMKVFSCLGFAGLTLSSLSWGVFDTYQKYQMRNAKAAFIKSALEFDSGVESMEGSAEIRKHLQQTSVPAVATHNALEQSPGTPREGSPSDIVQSDKEHPSTLDAEPHGQIAKRVAQTDSGHDESAFRAVIREAPIPQAETDSIHHEVGLNPSNQSSKGEQCKAFRKVQEAEGYLDLVMSIYPEDAAPIKIHEARMLRGWIRFYTPIFKTQCNPQTSSYKECLYTFTKSQILKKEPSLGLQRCLIRYFNALGKHPSWRLPRFYDQMKQLSKKLRPPHQHDLWIATDVRMFQMPLKITPISWALLAANHLVVVGIMILQLELTISWNNIRGLSVINTPGQLIPFVLGLGGLIRVVWCKWRLVMRGLKEEMLLDSRPADEYEMAMEKYLRWKEMLRTEQPPPEGNA